MTTTTTTLRLVKWKTRHFRVPSEVRRPTFPTDDEATRRENGILIRERRHRNGLREAVHHPRRNLYAGGNTRAHASVSLSALVVLSSNRRSPFRPRPGIAVIINRERTRSFPLRANLHSDSNRAPRPFYRRAATSKPDYYNINLME